MSKRPRFRAHAIAGMLAIAIIALTEMAARAQFVVFDPSNYEQAVRGFIQLEQQYAQLVTTYQLLKQQAQLAPGDLSARYRAIPTPYRDVVAPDTYGTNAGWVQTTNTGRQPLAGYQSSTTALDTYGSSINELSADELRRVKTAYGTLELADGVNVYTLETLGRLRRHSPSVELALRRIEDDSFSSDPDLNTQVAVLNKINAATVTSARTTKDTNLALMALLDIQLVEAKRRRDADAVAINAHIAFQSQARELFRQTSAGSADALASFRLP